MSGRPGPVRWFAGAAIFVAAGLCACAASGSGDGPETSAAPARRTGPVPQAWGKHVQAQLEQDARCAWPAPDGRAWVLNRPDVRVRIDAVGFVLEPQPGRAGQTEAGWHLAIAPRGLSGSAGFIGLGAGRLQASGDRVWIEHPGVLVHQLDNRAEALEQTFRVLAEAGSDFRVELAAAGPLELRLHAGALEAWQADRAVLRASPPVAFDADGARLEAAWELREPGPAIRVRGAGRYPVWIDPAWESIGEAQSSTWFGWSLNAAGDVNADGFGDVLVAAPYFHTGNPSAGKIYLYYGNAEGLSANPAWTSSGDNSNRALFGWSLASADVNSDGYSDLIVGAPSRTAAGKAFVFHGSFNGPLPASWTSVGDNAPGAFFGTSVASAGDVNSDGYDDVIIGAPAESFTDGPSAAPGKAFVFYGAAVGLGAAPVWTSSGEDQPGAGFGWCVASAGDVNADGYSDVAVSANLFDLGSADTGRAYLHLGSAGGLGQAAVWAESGDAQAGAQFGWSLAGAGDVNADGLDDLIVGAPGHDTPASGAGRAYAYQAGHPSSGLHPTYWWVNSGSNRAQAQFGFSVAGVGDVNADGFDDVLVGAPGDSTTASLAGRALLFNGSAAGPLSPSAFADSGDDEAGAGFGGAVAAAGDVNSDGAADLLVGAYAADGAAQDSGKAFLYLGAAGPGPGVCEPPGTACDDGLDCTHTDACNAQGTCQGTPFSCDDQNPCTDDLCRPDGTCAGLHNSAPCDDQDPCTGQDTCATAACRGTPLDCTWLDDGCAQGACDPASGQCQPQPAPDGTRCDDGDPCTADESCVGGICVHRIFTCDQEASGCGCGHGPGSPLLALLGWLVALGLGGRRR